jgi:integrase
MTLNELADRWLETPTKSGRKRTTVSVYNTRLRFRRYVQPTLGNRPIAVIKSSEITLLLDALMARHGLSPATAGRVRGELRAMLNWAWRRDLIIENPAIKADVPTVPLRPPTSPTCEELCQHLRVAEVEDSELELVMMFGASLGLRRSEIVALKWSHFDLSKQVVHIREGVTKAPGCDYETTPTKTGLHGFADFPLHPGLVARLEKRRDTFKRIVREVGGVDIDDGYIFSSDPLSQKPIHPDTLTGAFRKHKKRHPELPALSLQMLRRYAASDLFAEGEDQVTAAAVLRDTPETTARHYRAVRRDHARQVVLDIFERIETQREVMDSARTVS